MTKRPIFEFIHPSIRPSDVVQVFAFDDDYSFGVLQSAAHWVWFTERCSTLEERFRYTSNTVYDTFPWPQESTKAQVKEVASAAVALRKLRHDLMEREEICLRDLYRSMENPGEHPLKDAHEALDDAVREAYGMGKRDAPLSFLLALNLECAAREEEGKPIVGPGVPPGAPLLVTKDCVRMPRGV